MGRQGFALKHLVILFLVFFSIVGILVAAFAIRNPTSTSTSALSCGQKPMMVLDSTDKYAAMTIYHLKLINNCNSHNEFLIKISSFPDTPKHYDNWSWKFKNGDWNTPFKTEAISGTTDISLTIQRPLDSSGLPANIEKGVYRYFNLETSLASTPSLSDTLELIYTAD